MSIIQVFYVGAGVTRPLLLRLRAVLICKHRAMFIGPSHLGVIGVENGERTNPMPTPSLVEAVARAIDPGAWINSSPERMKRRNAAELSAQAALKAHAEWLESRAIEMNITGARALRDSFGWPNQTERAKHCFEAMISVANDTTEIHDSDCAVHNAPAFPAGPCDCGAEEQS